jgi:hypothetical protein
MAFRSEKMASWIDDLRELHCTGPGEKTDTYSLGDEKFKFVYSKTSSPRKEPGCYYPSTLFNYALGQITITFFYKEGGHQRQISAHFSADEVIGMLGDKWPNEDNVENIRRSVRERKYYPLIPVEPPAEKTFDAQGQTKKPGSHSESRHR